MTGDRRSWKNVRLEPDSEYVVLMGHVAGNRFEAARHSAMDFICNFRPPRSFIYLFIYRTDVISFPKTSWKHLTLGHWLSSLAFIPQRSSRQCATWEVPDSAVRPAGPWALDLAALHRWKPGVMSPVNQRWEVRAGRIDLTGSVQMRTLDIFPLFFLSLMNDLCWYSAVCKAHCNTSTQRFKVNWSWKSKGAQPQATPPSKWGLYFEDY